MEAAAATKSIAEQQITELVCQTEIVLAHFSQIRSEALGDKVDQLHDACIDQLQALTDSVDKLYELDLDNAETYAAEQASYEEKVDSLLRVIGVVKLKVLEEEVDLRKANFMIYFMV